MPVDPQHGRPKRVEERLSSEMTLLEFDHFIVSLFTRGANKDFPEPGFWMIPQRFKPPLHLIRCLIVECSPRVRRDWAASSVVVKRRKVTNWLSRFWISWRAGFPLPRQRPFQGEQFSENKETKSRRGICLFRWQNNTNLTGRALYCP